MVFPVDLPRQVEASDWRTYECQSCNTGNCSNLITNFSNAKWLRRLAAIFASSKFARMFKPEKCRISWWIPIRNNNKIYTEMIKALYSDGDNFSRQRMLWALKDRCETFPCRQCRMWRWRSSIFCCQKVTTSLFLSHLAGRSKRSLQASVSKCNEWASCPSIILVYLN